MDVELITITQSNIDWAVNENWARIFEAITFKVAMNSSVKLQGDWDFQGLYTIRGIVSNGPCSALPNHENV